MISASLLGHNLKEEKQLQQIRLPSIPTSEIKNYPKIYKVAFVRNPWERLLSCYLQKKNKIASAFFKRNKLSSELSFKDFATAVCDIPDHKSDRHFRSQFTFITDTEANLLPNFIGAFSSFSEDIARVLKTNNVPPVEIPHYNKTSHGHYTDYYSTELAEAVGRRYDIDKQLFGFEYGKDKPKDFYNHWQRPIPNSIKVETLKYKSKKLQHCLAQMNENTMLPPQNLRQRLRILLKGK